MEMVLRPPGGLILLGLYGLAMVSLTMWGGRTRSRDKSEFLLASRKVGVWTGALSIAASWIWAPALFVGSQKAYTQGLPGIFWFAFPNVLSLIVFAPLALRIRKILPSGYTLPELMRERHGRGVHILYLIQFFGLQICSFAVQVLAGASLIHVMTGLSFHVVALILVAIAVTYSLIGGLRASVLTDVAQMVLIYGVIGLVVPWVVVRSGGVSTVAAGLGGIGGDYRNLFDPWVAYSFGIPVTIGLLAGPIGDQQHWQRAYALRSDGAVIRTFLYGAALFVVVPLALAVLGFVGAATGQAVADSQMIGPVVVANTLPRFMMVAFGVMLISGLCSTLDSVLCAWASLASVDFMEAGVSTARLSMLVLVGLAVGIAFIPGLTIVHLFLFYGTWRASTMIPTVLTLYWPRLNSRAVFVAILASLLLGAPVYAAGTVVGNPHLSVAGSLMVVFIGLTVCVGGSYER